uniref:Uncharacterized protein n=1 Tax=Glossina brevipalpis TaxID=37001 RepID=A0A1A9WQA3_9MUSC
MEVSDGIDDDIGSDGNFVLELVVLLLCKIKHIIRATIKRELLLQNSNMKRPDSRRNAGRTYDIIFETIVLTRKSHDFSFLNFDDLLKDGPHVKTYH